MAPLQELLAALAYIRDRTGDPNAWQTGLTPQEVAAVVSPATRPEQLQAILAKIRTQHPDVFGTGMPNTRPPQNPVRPPPDAEQGAAADAIARAEEALSQQNTVSSQLDMQVISAILNAHRTSVEGGQALGALQREVEAAVHTRSDLDTPAGARDFQRFLIGKLRDIRAIVLDASLDDTSKSALMAAWTSLYDASRNEADSPGEQAREPEDAYALDDPDADWDPATDSAPLDDPAAPAPRNEIPPTAVAPAAPTPPGFPGLGAGSLPGLGTAPGAMGGWGLPLPGLQDAERTDPALRERDERDRAKPPADERDPEQPDDRAENAAGIEPAAAGPTPVTLPDGETLTAASPQLAAAIKAAVAGAPIADAFRQQGITIPAPGTPVPDPLDAQRLAPGDVGIFTDRHALALSPGKALLDGQIQHIATVSGPSFLGWEHPPGPAAASATEPVTPTPTRPATAPTTAQPKPAGPPGGA